jgi:hypothetical protein
MEMKDPLTIGVLLALAWCVAGLALAWRGALAFGPKRYRSRPAGDASRGVVYAFGEGMLPGAKESVRTHLGSWGAGVLFHLGTFSALALLALGLTGWAVPRSITSALGGLALAGAACGLFLLARRAASPDLRSFSVPDDFVSNLLTTGFSAVAGLMAFGLLKAAALEVSAVALLLYLPLGKIRHCVFFFPTRYFFGTYFGRRGVLPPAGRAPRG